MAIIEFNGVACDLGTAISFIGYEGNSEADDRRLESLGFLVVARVSVTATTPGEKRTVSFYLELEDIVDIAMARLVDGVADGVVKPAEINAFARHLSFAGVLAKEHAARAVDIFEAARLVESWGNKEGEQE